MFAVNSLSMPWAEGLPDSKQSVRHCPYKTPLMLQKKSGDDAVKSLEGAEGLQLSKLLEGDPEFDSNLSSSKDFLSAQGLQCLAS